jgi:hypothetical protein
MVFEKTQSESEKPNVPEFLHKKMNLNPVLIASFSEASDDIAMWGRYSNDQGINIGIEKRKFDNWKLLEDKHQEVYVGRCIYDTEIKSTLAKRIYELHEKNGSASALDLFVNLLKISPFFKNNSFSHEKEWRVVCEYSPKAKKDYGRPVFRINRNTIIPYGTLELFSIANLENKDEIKLKIPEIILSPRLSRSLHAKQMIEHFLLSNNIKIEKIFESNSSLR